MTIEHKLWRAKKVALTSTFRNSRGKLIRVGAVHYKGNKLISSSVNQKKVHPLMQYYNQEVPFNRIPHLHAEIAALLRGRWEIGREGLVGCSMYIARKLNNDDEWGNARPCPACIKALYDMGIDKIVYTLENEYGYGVEYLC